jgi:hypothetical protein
MKNRYQGPSLYFASDKNIFDALNQHKVDTRTVMKLFDDRNIIVSKKTPRESLALYFARLNHDFEDNQLIAARLGVAPRRERITSVQVNGIPDKESLTVAIGKVKEELEKLGDVIQITNTGTSQILNIQYTTVDYTRSEFSQVRTQDGLIEFVGADQGFTVRSTQNDYVGGVRDMILSKIETTQAVKLDRTVVSLFDVPDARLRSKFFDKLTNELPEFRRLDVLAAYVYKPRPGGARGDDAPAEIDTHVERVSLRGVGVTRSDVFNKLLSEDNYYITRISWLCSRTVSTGTTYEIDAAFEEPGECTAFSFVLSGVYPVEEGVATKRKRIPTMTQVDDIARAIDAHSRRVMLDIKKEAGRTDSEVPDAHKV